MQRCIFTKNFRQSSLSHFIYLRGVDYEDEIFFPSFCVGDLTINTWFTRRLLR